MADHVLFNDTLGSSTRTLGNVVITGVANWSAVDALTAHAGGGQSSATALTKTVNRVTTVATAADSVTLPVSQAGMMVAVVNSGANSMQVFGTTPDTINAAATGTGVAQAAAKTALYVCPVAGKWFQLLSA